MEASAVILSTRHSAHGGYWRSIRTVIVARFLPAAVFAAIGFFQLQHALSAWTQVVIAGNATALLESAIPASLYLLFCCIPVILFLTRPTAKATDHSWLAWIAAFGGTFILLLVGAYLPIGPRMWSAPEWLVITASVVEIGVLLLALMAMLTLRRNISIVPQARQLVKTGIYARIRHPLYATEILASAAILTTQGYLIPALAFLVFAALEIVRSFYEERLLIRVFPEYSLYRQRTARLIPFVW